MTGVLILAAGVFWAWVPGKACAAPAGALYEPIRDLPRHSSATVAQARGQGKRVLIEVGTDQCVWTRRLDGLLNSDAQVAGMLGSLFIHMRVPPEALGQEGTFLSRLPRPEGVPHLYILDEEGGLLVSQETGALESGQGHDRGKVLDFLTQWAPESPEAAATANASLEMIPAAAGLDAEEIRASELPVVVLFYAEGAPLEMKRLAALEDSADRYFGKVNFFRIEAAAAKRAGKLPKEAAATPYLLFIQDGKRRGRTLPKGAQGEPAKVLEAWLK